MADYYETVQIRDLPAAYSRYEVVETSLIHSDRGRFCNTPGFGRPVIASVVRDDRTRAAG
jgi:hypothetical protein